MESVMEFHDETGILQSFDGVNVGDELVVRPDLTEDESYGGITANCFMVGYAGLAVQVSRLTYTSSSRCLCVRIEDDDAHWYWSPTMFLNPSFDSYVPAEESGCLDFLKNV